MRKAERQMEKVEKKSDKQYKQAKNAHYKHQANKTKRMMKKDARRARRMRNHQRSNPFYWTNSPYTPFRRCGGIAVSTNISALIYINKV